MYAKRVAKSGYNAASMAKKKYTAQAPVDHPVIDYAQVLALIPADKRAHLLLGNGFSVACNPIFQYASR